MNAAKLTKLSILAAFLMFFAHGITAAQCCNSPAHSVGFGEVSCSACCPVPVQTFKVVCETVFDEQRVVRYRPVWETELRQRPYTVARQVAETEMREERYRVRIPIQEVEIRDYSYERVRYVPETCMREEVTCVMRPVQKTCEREEVSVVSRPVQETRMETRQSTVARQVTTYETKYVDQGAYTDQLVLKPCTGLFSHKLEFQGSRAVTDEYSGQVTYQRPGLYWTPTNKGKYSVEKIWVPNPQPVQVPRTFTVPETVCEQVPVTTTRFIQEQVVRRVPVTVTEMVKEQVVRQVPHTTMRPVREIVENKVPVKVCRWQEEERVRQVPYTSWKTVCEQRMEEYEVKTCRMVAEEEIVRTPRTIQRCVPINCLPAPTLDCSVPPSCAVIPSAGSESVVIPWENESRTLMPEPSVRPLESMPAPALGRDYDTLSNGTPTYAPPTGTDSTILEKPSVVVPNGTTTAPAASLPAAGTGTTSAYPDLKP